MKTIGLLIADYVDDPIKRRYGDYSSMIRQMFDNSGVDGLQFRSFQVSEEQYPSVVDECDGYIISGSRRSCYEPIPWIQQLQEFIQQLHAIRKKTVGICFGHQCIASALGGETRKAENGWGVGIHRYEIAGEGTWSETPARTVQLIASHQDQVSRLPYSATVTLQSDFCPIAGMRIADHVLTIQPHPEFTASYAEELLRIREDILGDKFEGALNSLSEPTDEKCVARSIATFLKG